MKGKVLLITGASCALLIGSSALGASARDNDQIRGAEWNPDRAVTQNLPSPRYRSRSFEGDRYQHSRNQSQRDIEGYRGGYQRYQQEQGRFEKDHRRYTGEQRTTYRSRNRSDAHTLLGTLIRVKGNSYVVNLLNGSRSRLHVDENTLLDAGLERGDRLIAKVRPDGHAISIIKDRGRKGEHFVAPGAPETRYDSYERVRSERNGRHHSDRF